MKKLELIDEALKRGARPTPACAMVQIAMSTYYSWKNLLGQTGSCADRRPQAEHPPPSWRYSDAYRSEPVAECNSPAYQDLTAYEICCDQLV